MDRQARLVAGQLVVKVLLKRRSQAERGGLGQTSHLYTCESKDEGVIVRGLLVKLRLKPTS